MTHRLSSSPKTRYSQQFPFGRMADMGGSNRLILLLRRSCARRLQDGTIDVDVAVKVLTPPGVRMPGFAGVMFRAKPDGSEYELFYLRPKNALAENQSMRNHAVQYSAEPGYGWYKLRREWPFVYE